MKTKFLTTAVWFCVLSLTAPAFGATNPSWMFSGGDHTAVAKILEQQALQDKKNQLETLLAANDSDNESDNDDNGRGNGDGNNDTSVDSSFVFGVRYVGGREIPLGGDETKTIWVEQATVYSFVPNNPTHPPIVMVPGMGLAASMYMTTTDSHGKGWAQIFAEAGYPVYVYEIPEYSTSGGFDVNKLAAVDPLKNNSTYFGDPYVLPEAYPDGLLVTNRRGKELTIYPDPLPESFDGFPSFSIYNQTDVRKWIGVDDTGEVFMDVQFPMDPTAVEQFEKSFPYRWKDDAESEDYAPVTGNVEYEALVDLYDFIGSPFILMAHSMGAASLPAMLAARPDAIKAVIAYEPAGMVKVPGDFGSEEYMAGIYSFTDLLGNRPYLTIYGDHVAERTHLGRQEAAYAVYDVLEAEGKVAGKIDLPSMGIYGNTHMMAMDSNNAQIAGLLIDWLDENEELGSMDGDTGDVYIIDTEPSDDATNDADTVDDDEASAGGKKGGKKGGATATE